MLSVKNLWFKYPNNDWILKNINLEIKKGFFSLVGPSGCGKSTMCLALNGLIPHEISGIFKGDVVVNGTNTKKEQVKNMATQIGMVFQNPDSQLFSLCAEDEISFGPGNLALSEEKIKKRVDDAIRILKIEDLRYKNPEQMSMGEKQKTAIASALVMRPKILVLDEPTANLDPISTAEIFEILKKLSKEILIFLAEHDIENVLKYSDRIAVMDNGEIMLEGRPEDIINKIDRYVALPKICRVSKKLDITPICISASDLAKKVRLKKRLNIQKNKNKEETIVEIKNLCFSYFEEKEVLNNISLKINKGEFVAIVGQNGAGKSNLAMHFNGLLKPTSGDIIIDGINTKNAKTSQLSKTVGYVFQNPDLQMFEDNIADEISFGPKNLKLDTVEINKRVDEVLKYANLKKIKDKDPFSLSIGQKRRITIASVISMKPKIIIIDEPSTGLDIRTAEYFMKLVCKLNSSGHTIIMITHDMDLVADYADRVIVMKNGKIRADNSTRAVFKNESVLRQANLRQPQLSRLGNLAGEPDILIINNALDALEKK